MPAPSTAAIVLLAAAVAIGCQPADEFPGTRADSIAVGAARPVGPPPPPLPDEVAASGQAGRDSGQAIAEGPAEPAEPPPDPPAESARASTDAPTAVPGQRPRGDTTQGRPAEAERTASPQPRQPPDTAAEQRAVRPEPQPAPTPPPVTADCALPPLDAESGTRIVTVYFTCGEQIRPVQRRVRDTQAVLRASLEQLLGGPSDDELLAGFHSFFSPQTAGMLNSVAVGADGVAHIDFEDFSRMIPNASSSAGSAQLLGQLRATIFQFPTVRAASLTFQGDCDAFWNWLQRGCQQLTPTDPPLDVDAS